MCDTHVRADIRCEGILLAVEAGDEEGRGGGLLFGVPVADHVPVRADEPV